MSKEMSKKELEERVVFLENALQQIHQILDDYVFYYHDEISRRVGLINFLCFPGYLACSHINNVVDLEEPDQVKEDMSLSSNH